MSGNNTGIQNTGTGCPTKNPLQRDGTSQYQRMMEALYPGSAPVHEFSIRDWMKFAWHYADRLNYFNTANSEAIEGNWQRFMLEETEIEKMLLHFRRKDADPSAEPHLALFISFLQLLRYPHRDMNRITGRHLDFYYKQVLQLKKKEASPDKVHLVFELAKNLSSVKLNDDALFDAGKDKKGIPLRYGINTGPVFNTAKAELLKSVYHSIGKSLRFAEVADSADGSGTPLKEDEPSWHAFGFDQKEVSKGSNQLVKLPAAKPGFALASSILLLKEGERKITITIDLEFPSAGIDYAVFSQLQNNLVVLLTGEKDWVSPKKLTVTKKPASGNGQLIIELEIDSAEKPIIAYNSKLHKENFNTDQPVARFLIDAEKDKGYNSYETLSKASIKKTTIHVSVTGLKDLLLENDEGKLDPAKPFMPFTAVPKKDSNFYIGSSEIFQKNWKSISLNIDWKSRPADFRKHYTAYRTEFLGENFSKNSYDVSLNGTSITSSNNEEVEGDDYFKVDLAYIKNNRWSNDQADKDRELFTENPMIIGEKNNQSQNPVTGNYFYGSLYNTGYSVSKLYTQNYLQYAVVLPVFQLMTYNPGFISWQPQPDRFTINTKNNFLRLTLTGRYGFFHQQFASLYAAGMTIPGAVLPKEPYTPLIASLTVDYDAEITNDFFISGQTNQQKLDNYRERNIQLFHELPFGQGEQHIFLKEQALFLTEKTRIPPVPVFPTEGELYIGLKNAAPETIVSILFQVAEGSENPESASFEKEVEILWYALCNNEWKPLNQDFIISDNTNNFLQPGLIKFLLPKETNDDNTILPKQYRWLKAQLPPSINADSVCRFISALAQAEEAIFTDTNNDLSHLSVGLPASVISKMVNKQAAIKSVKQPFGSFDGLAAESDNHFYIRVSERLRHKNRAVNIWDYERLVLEGFPSVYKVKCLNHTSSDFELAPGSVRIIPVPDVRNKSMYDILKPRVSKNMLGEIQSYLSTLNGLHIDCKAENPQFEEIQFLFHVKFHTGIDPKTYKKILANDIKKYLAPWSDNEFAEIDFGGELYKSRAIQFIEERPYVDFITDFKMYNKAVGNTDSEMIMARNARAILTSYKEHSIETIEPPVC